MVSNLILYAVAIIFLIYSYLKDKKKTKQALTKGYKSFINILPEFLTIILLIGMVLSILNPQIVSSLIGTSSGIWGILSSSIIGAITLIPGFIAFPLAKNLLDYGAGIVPIAAFVSSLMMVGVVTIPLEKKYFGSKLTYIRNALAFVFSIVIALVMGAMPWIY
ncbi:MAG: permease [Clostridiaceae bacterium BRH_c20a]|nr:MAG: permease [Clostridiaceae bacterium BRH_c20a]